MPTAPSTTASDRSARWSAARLGTTIGLRPTLAIAGLGGVLAVLWLLASPVRHIRTLDEPAA